MTLAERAAHLTEKMDDPACSEQTLRRTYARFALVNIAVARWRRVYRRYVRPELADVARAGRTLRLLDVGCGGGDVLRLLVRAARRDGFRTEGVGIDPDPRAIDAAKPAPHVRYRRAHSRDLVRAGERFDVVVSNHVLHHLSAPELSGLFADSAELGERISLHSDIARGRLAYAAFAIAAAPIAPGTFVHADGLTSIRRSYTAAELAAVVPAAWRIDRPAAFRLLAVHRGTAGARAPGSDLGVN